MNLFEVVISILFIAWALSFVAESLIDVYFYYLKRRQEYLATNKEEAEHDEEIIHRY